MSSRVIARDGLEALFAALVGEGYELIGPTLTDDAIVYDRIDSINDLPEGWTDQQDGGKYRVVKRDDPALFGFNLGPTSWKRFLFPPKTELLRIQRHDGNLIPSAVDQPNTKMAFIGVRACELAAIAIQDRVFMGEGHADPTYASRRRDLFVVALNCHTTGGTCFCVSMGTGPRCTSGYDLVINELIEGTNLDYVIESGSKAGERLVGLLAGREQTKEDEQRIGAMLARVEQSMGRSLKTEGIRDLLVENPGHTRWDLVAARCLSCGNCTLACPTCFCSTMTDTVSLDGEATRTRSWDSCFSFEFSMLHQHPVRGSTRSKYRQWMTHKLATWYDQFGTSGCVGCGRCVTWCPVGIDITEEVAAIRGEVAL